MKLSNLSALAVAAFIGLTASAPAAHAGIFSALGDVARIGAANAQARRTSGGAPEFSYLNHINPAFTHCVNNANPNASQDDKIKLCNSYFPEFGH